MRIKGKTIIELKDADTGHVERFEDTNMVTNGLKDFLDTYGLFTNTNLNVADVRQNEGWKNLLGGIMLFDKPLTENAENTFMPSGVNMVGNGAVGVSNSGQVTEMGSYNATESGVRSDGSVRFVYDFSTAQANGNIASVCLTSKHGGYIGMGNASGNKAADSSYDMSSLQNISHCLNELLYAGGLQYYWHLWMYAVYEENALYAVDPRNLEYSSNDRDRHWRTTGKIDVLKLGANFKEYDLRGSYKLDYTSVKETYSVDIPQEIIDYMGTSNSYVYPFSDPFEKNIYIVFRLSTFNAGTFMWVMKIDKDMNATAYKVFNNTGVDFGVSHLRTVFNGEYMWVIDTSTYKLYGIKYADSTQVIATELATSNSFYNLHNLSNGLICAYDYKSSNSHQIYDVENNTLKTVNGVHNINYATLVPFSDKNGAYLAYNYNYKTNNISVMKDPRYLATINNLTNPVTKTASKTMKVTYTLTYEV